MGKKDNTEMALMMFPSLERRMAAHPRMIDNFFRGGNLFAEMDSTWRNMTSDLDSRRQTFLSEMDIDEVPAQQGPYSHSYCYSSSTIQRGDGQPVTRSVESFRNSSGQQVSKHMQSMGDKVVEETVKNGETTRTLTNLSEAELEDFNKSMAFSEPLMYRNEMRQEKELPAALEADLTKMRNTQQ